MGATFAKMREVFPPQSTFDPSRDMPDLSDKVVIVTGGNSGIGKETVKQLLKKNAKVYLAARAKPKADAAIAELRAETGKTAIFLECDLASLSSVKRAADEFKANEKSLHILFNNGGVMLPPIDRTTEDGYDLQFGTNVLGHALLTFSLIDQLEAGAKSSKDGKARIVNTSSNGAYGTNNEGVKFSTLKDSPVRTSLGNWGLYFQSKYGNYAFSCELAKRLSNKGITSNSLNPGGIRTELAREVPRWQFYVFSWTLFPVEYGALTQLYLGTSPAAANVTGRWFVPWARESKFLGPQNVDIVGPELWKWLEEQCSPYLSA